MSGGSTGTSPCGGGGGVPGVWQWQPEIAGGKKGKVVLPCDEGVKMFNVFTANVKRGGGGGGKAFPVPLLVLGGHGARGYAGG